MADNSWAVSFNRWRETIEAAETPFAKFAILILTPLAALIPAVLTSMHMNKLFMEMFSEFTWGRILAGILSTIIGIVLELLGYVGALQLIRAIYDVIRKGKDEYLVPAILNLMVYVFYLVGIYQINVALAKYFEIPDIFSRIIGLLAFITVPTGILAANHLSLKENREADIENRNFKSNERLKRTALKHGINVFNDSSVTYPAETKSVAKQKYASDYKEEIWGWMDRYYSKYSKPPKVVEVWRNVLEKHEITYNSCKGYVSTQRTDWAQQNEIEL